MKKRNYRKRQYYLRDKKKQQPLIYEMLKLQKKIRFLRIIMKILSLHCFFFSAQNLLLYWKNKKMPSKEREDSFGNISSNINRWVAVAVLHPLGKRQPHVRSLLCFGFVFPPAVGSAAGSIGLKQECPEEIHLYCCCFCYFVEMRLFFWWDHLSLWWRSWFSIILKPLWSTLAV